MLDYVHQLAADFVCLLFVAEQVAYIGFILFGFGQLNFVLHY